MTSYPGNPSLSAAVKDRVQSTFQQTVSLYKQGRKDEVASGCTLILQMDPMFDPAKKLLEKLRNPAMPLDVDALVPTSPTADMMAEARQAMAARDFQQVVHLTTEILTEDLMNDEARILGDEAREKMEAGPFVDQFVKRCDQAIANGNLAAAKSDLQKARALDPDHPEIRRIERELGSRDSGSASGGGGFSFDSPSPSPSFVVDPPKPAAPERGTAHASDFGFTFEEEKAPADQGFAGFSFGAPASTPAADPFAGFNFGAPPPPPAAPPATPPGGFSFDSPAAPSFSFDSPAPAPAPPAPAPAPASGGFDFSTASMETSPDEQKKVDQYLADGDRAFDRGEYQNAIDIWSRIFLIDVTNDQASERIERAKGKRREIEGQVDGVIAAGVAAYDRKDHDTARAKFAEALRLDPSNSTASDYMERLTSTPTEGGAAAYEVPYVAPETEKYDIFADEPMPGDAPLMPPDPAAAPPIPAAGTSKSKKTAAAKAAAPAAKKSLPMGAIAAVLGILVLGAAGWFGYNKFFGGAPEYDATATQAKFTQATALANRGQFDQAIQLLQDIKADDPDHDRAILMIADLQQKKSQAAAMIDGKPAAQFFQEQLTTGRAAFEAHDYVGAKTAFEQAMRVKPLGGDAKTMYDAAAQQVAKLEGAKTLFAEQRYQEAIANLQSLLAQDPQNQNIQRMITDAQFNLGVMALRDERLPEAITQFDQVLRVQPDNELARRSRELAVRYEGEPKKDLLYKIYVKYLPLRQAS